MNKHDRQREGKNPGSNTYPLKGPRGLFTENTPFGDAVQHSSEERKVSRTCAGQNTKITGIMNKRL